MKVISPLPRMLVPQEASLPSRESKESVSSMKILEVQLMLWPVTIPSTLQSTLGILAECPMAWVHQYTIVQRDRVLIASNRRILLLSWTISLFAMLNEAPVTQKSWSLSFEQLLRCETP